MRRYTVTVDFGRGMMQKPLRSEVEFIVQVPVRPHNHALRGCVRVCVWGGGGEPVEHAGRSRRAKTRRFPTNSSSK